MKKFISIILFMFVGINTVYGECSSADIVLYKEDANDVNISYEVEEDAVDVMDAPIYDSYILKIENLKDNYYVIDDDIGIKIGSNHLDDSLVSYENGYYLVSGINSGKKTFKVYRDECNRSLKTIELFLPVYNYYYEDTLCDGVNRKKVKLCSKWLDKEITYQEFYDEMSKYREENNIDEDSLTSSFSYFFKEHFISIIIILSLFVLFIVFLIIKKRKKVVL